MSFLPAALPALLPWAEKSLSNVSLVHTQQDNFLIVLVTESSLELQYPYSFVQAMNSLVVTR